MNQTDLNVGTEGPKKMYFTHTLSQLTPPFYEQAEGRWERELMPSYPRTLINAIYVQDDSGDVLRGDLAYREMCCNA